MTTIPSNLRRVLRREPRVRPTTEPVAAPSERVEAPPVEIAPNDPLVAYFSSATGAVDIGALQLDSPALEGLREAGIRLVVPLVSQGELIGLLNLGPRRSEQEYSADDRKLLNDLAGHAAPAVRVAQLVREQEAEVRQRERIEQELRVAQLIQQQFLPHELPDLPGWRVGAYYGPAREVGGDFYDFIRLPDDQIGIVVGDVTDKGVPAALVMATTHSILRAEAPRLIAPSAVLTRANELLVDEMPAHMFVTCLYAVLNPATGRLRYANAGHNVPYVSTEAGVTELRATGMPLGLLPGMEYEEKEATLAPGEIVLLHSDGLAEAHNGDREMFGFPRVAALTGEASDGEVLIDRLLLHDIPPQMFVTCLYGVLDPTTGRLRYANAGHNPPYVHTSDGVVELRATGMPLGAMPDMIYEEKETTLSPGDTVLLHSDGLVEAHDPERKMFGFPRLAELVGGCPGGPELIQLLLGELDGFTGPDWEQEDDITLVALQRAAVPAVAKPSKAPALVS